MLRIFFIFLTSLFVLTGFGQTGPGGIGSTSGSTIYWYDAHVADETYSDAQKMGSWANIGSNGSAAVVTTIGKQPTFRDNASDNINGYPVAQFNGSFLEIPDDADFNLSQISARTVTVVFKTGNGGGGTQTIYEQGGTTRGLNIYIKSNTLYIGGYNTVNDGPGSPWGYSYVSTSVGSGTANVLNLIYKGNSSSTGSITAYLNGSLVGTVTGVGFLYPHVENGGFGAKIEDTRYHNGPKSGTGDFFNGFIAEIILHDYALSTNDRRILLNALSAKYDIPLGLQDLYTMDDPANGDYDHDVVGIGRLLFSSHTNSIGQGFLRISNPSALGGSEYMFAGHDNGSTCSDADVPLSLNARLTRVWRVSHIGDVGTVDLEFDLSTISAPSGSDLRLLVDTDGVFANATIYSPSSSSGQSATFSGVSIPDGAYITVAAETGAFGEPPSETTTWVGGQDSDWFNANNWSNGAPTSMVSANVPAGTAFSPVVTGDFAECYSINIDAGATFTISGTDTLDIYGSFESAGTFVYNQSTINLVGGCGLQEITVSGTGSIDFYNIRQKNLWGGEINGSQINLWNALMIERGNFNTGDSMRLVSDAVNTARITEVKNGDLSGEILMERYIDAGATNWRFLTYAVSGADLEQLDDDFITAGFPGTDYPNFTTSGGQLWPSMYRYDETAGTVLGDGYYPPSSTGDVLAVGEGLWVWCGDTITGTQPFTIDYRGPVNTGDISLPVTYTPAAGTYEDDGWNMVGNPYPCTIDWEDAAWTKTNIDGAIYIWNPDLQQYASYVAGVGTNGGSRYIASSQAFWVRSNASSPTLNASEGVKVNQDHGFIKTSPTDLIRLKLTHPWNTDETVLRFADVATNGFDPSLDAQKFDAYNLNLAKLSSTWGGIEYSVNSMANPSMTISIPLIVTIPSNATCEIKATDLSGMEQFACVYLEDTLAGTMINLKQDTVYTFTSNSGVDTGRFVLHLTPKVDPITTSTSCADSQDGAMEINPIDSAGYGLSLIHLESGNTINTQQQQGATTISNLDPGTYILTYLGGFCGVQTDTVIIDAPERVDANVALQHVSCSGCCDGEAMVAPTGGTAPYTVEWLSMGAFGTQHTGLCPGVYDVIITDANNCLTTKSVEIQSAVGIDEHAQDIDLKIYPNPASEIMFVESQQEVECRIVDASGRTIALFTVDGKLGIAVNDYAPGIYVLITDGQAQRFLVR